MAMSQATGKHIVVLDDEQTISFTLGAILSRAGYVAEWYLNPREALEAIRQQPPDLMLSDVAMPEMTGIELAIRLFEENIRTKVLLRSGNTATAEILQEAERAGYSFEVLAKPISPPISYSGLSKFSTETSRVK
jgi:CheY-like chemotaxis protein